jgi:hypothetical protein
MFNVKGILFADYVRMIRSSKRTDWSEWLLPEDVAYLRQTIEANEWYPMATFERLGNAILAVVARGDLEAVRMWGRYSVDYLVRAYPMLLAPGDAVETLNRFRVLRATFFDFEALSIPYLHEEEAQIAVEYHMGPIAEEAASMQTLGFFERLLELAGATGVEAKFRQRSWKGDDRTLIDLTWSMA